MTAQLGRPDGILEDAYLVATGAWAEVLVGEVELLDAQRAHLLLVIVDELVLLCARHGGVVWRGVCGVSCSSVVGWRLKGE
jgi:hypothetical protein